MSALASKILELVAELAHRGGGVPGLPPVRPDILHAGSPDFTETVARITQMPLVSFAAAGSALELRVPWLATTLWFVPSETEVAQLEADGVSRGRIWTARELFDLMETPDLTAAVMTIARMKVEFAGEIVEVRPRWAAEPGSGPISRAADDMPGQLEAGPQDQE